MTKTCKEANSVQTAKKQNKELNRTSDKTFICGSRQKEHKTQGCGVLIGLVLAAGRGTRLLPYTDAVPKEILPIADVPVIEYSIKYLGQAGINKIYIVLSSRKASLLEYIKDGKWLNVDVTYLFQNMKYGIGTAKAIEVAKPWIKDEFMVFYGDSFFHPGEFVGDIMKFHYQKKASATVGLYEVSDPIAFGVARIDPKGALIDLIERPDLNELKKLRADDRYLANSGPLIFKPDIFEYITKTKPARQDGEYRITDTIRIMIKEGEPIFGFRIPPNVFWRDIGTTEARLEADEYALRNIGFSRTY